MPEMLEDQKKVAKKVVTIFCVSVLWMGMGLLCFPVFFPLLAIEKELTGTMTGIILCIPPFTQLLMIPIITRLKNFFGVERTICVAGVLFGAAWIVLSFSDKIDEKHSFFWMVAVANVCIGFATACNVVGE